LVYDNSVNPTFSIDISGISSLPKIGVKNISASIDFGTLISDTIVELHSLESNAKDRLSWSISGTKNLINDKIKLSGIKGYIDLADLSAPIINLSSAVDLSQYGGMLKEVKKSKITNATISKDGFKTNIQIDINSFPIWAEKNVVLNTSPSGRQAPPFDPGPTGLPHPRSSPRRAATRPRPACPSSGHRRLAASCSGRRPAGPFVP